MKKIPKEVLNQDGLTTLRLTMAIVHANGSQTLDAYSDLWGDLQEVYEHIKKIIIQEQTELKTLDI